MARNDFSATLRDQHYGNAGTVYDEGYKAFWEKIKYPYADQARRDVWQNGYNDAKNIFESS